MEGARGSLGYGFEVLELECIISFTFRGTPPPGTSWRKVCLMQRDEMRWRDLDHAWYAIDRRE